MGLNSQSDQNIDETQANNNVPDTVGVVFRPRKSMADDVFKALDFLKNQKVHTVIIGDHPLSDEEVKANEIDGEVTWEEAVKVSPDLIITFGGDGTLLHTLNELGYPSNTFFLGINYGNLGFLTEGSLDEGTDLLSAIFEGKYWIDRRFLLDIVLWRGDEQIWQGYSLNELLLRQETMARPLKARLFIDKVEMAAIQADGFIVATPTGSTAYALSAGGPIIHPFLNCFEITPVAPHSMNSRSIVVHDKGVASLVVDSSWHSARIYVDGIGKCDLLTDDRVSVTSSTRKVSFIRVKQHHYYKTLRDKLNWNL